MLFIALKLDEDEERSLFSLLNLANLTFEPEMGVEVSKGDRLLSSDFISTVLDCSKWNEEAEFNRAVFNRLLSCKCGDECCEDDELDSSKPLSMSDVLSE